MLTWDTIEENEPSRRIRARLGDKYVSPQPSHKTPLTNTTPSRALPNQKQPRLRNAHLHRLPAHLLPLPLPQRRPLPIRVAPLAPVLAALAGGADHARVFVCGRCDWGWDVDCAGG
jgi:hypothetical protein